MVCEPNTDPADPASTFRVLGINASSANVTVRFSTVFGKHYVVERTSSLVLPPWATLKRDAQRQRHADGPHGRQLARQWRRTLLPGADRAVTRAGAAVTNRMAGQINNKTVILRSLASRPGELKVTAMQTSPTASAHKVPRLRPTLGALSMLAALTGGTLTARAQQPAAPPSSGYHLEATWKPGGEGGWDYATVDPSAHRLYVTRTDRVQVIDTEDGQTVGEVPGLEGGHGTALVPDLNRGFATSTRPETEAILIGLRLDVGGPPVQMQLVFLSGKSKSIR